MKKISYEELGEYIGTKASEYFGRWYSKEIDDYLDEIVSFSDGTSLLDEGKISETNICHIELSEVGKAPLIIEWEEDYYYKNHNDYMLSNYSEVEYYVY